MRIAHAPVHCGVQPAALRGMPAADNRRFQPGGGRRAGVHRIISQQHPDPPCRQHFDSRAKARRQAVHAVSGWAFRYKSLSDGRRQILDFLLPGDLIGLQQEFSDSAMHGIEAVTDVSLCVFPHAALWEVFRSHPRLGYDITWLAAHEEGMVDDNLLTTGRRNAAERVAMLLMHLYRRLERIGLAP